MAKKYVNLDEAAARLGISVEKMKSLREAGEIRGFSDRGTWKFKAEDVEELVRSRQLGSDPEIPLIGGSGIGAGAEDELGSHETVIRRGSVFDDEAPTRSNPSDSDVRLILDDSLRADEEFEAPRKPKSDSDIRLVDSGVHAARPDSDSDVKLVDSGVHGGKDSDSDVKLVDSDVRLASEEDLLVTACSDSDVRVISDSAALTESDIRLAQPGKVDRSGIGVKTDPDIPLIPAPSAGDPAVSDSDVKLFEGDSAQGKGKKIGDSDSDVKLFDDDSSPKAVPDESDSDVKLVNPGLDAPDSDVQLVGSGSPGRPGSDSDVQLIGASGISGSDSDVQLIQSGGKAGLRSDSDSDVALVSADGSGLLAPDDDDDDGGSIFDDADPFLDGATIAAGSGIFSPNDSGINLEVHSSGIQLDEGSGIALGGLASGVDAGLSGISLDSGSGIGLSSGSDDDRHEDRTETDIPTIGVDDGDDTFNLAMDDDGDEDGEDGVILFEDEDADDYNETMIRTEEGVYTKKQKKVEDEEEDDEYEDEEEFDEEFDDYDDEFDDADDELEVVADIEGEDDELDDLDAFDDDGDFEDDFDAGGIAAPLGRGMEAPVEADWGWPMFTGLLLTFGFLAFGGVVMYDLLRTMWVVDGPTAAGTTLLDKIADMFAG